MTFYATDLSSIPHTLTRTCAALAAAALAPTATADVTTLNPVADAAIYSQDGDTANGSGRYMFAGRINGPHLRRALMRFDTSSIPAGSTIDSVSLTLFMNRTLSGSQANSLHVLTNDWTEGASEPEGQEGGGTVAEQSDATWLYRSYDTSNPAASPAWNTPGGDFIATPSATTDVSFSGQSYTWTSAQMASDVQAWVDSPTANFGWILIGVEGTQTTTKRFITRNHPEPTVWPALVVNYTPPAACAPDVNHDGVLTAADFTAWINAFNNNDPECDQNNDGSCTPTDFTAWIANFNAGC